MPPTETVESTEEVHAEAPVTNVGDKYRDALAKIEAKSDNNDRSPEPDSGKTDSEAAAKKEASDTKGSESQDTQVEKKSPLDQIVSDEKPAEKTVDVLAEFDEKTANWKRAREVMRSQSEEKTKLSDKIKDLESRLTSTNPKWNEEKATLTKELEAAKAEREKYSEAIKAVNIEQHPEFREKYIEGAKKLVEKAAKRVKDFGGDIEKFADAVQLTGKRRTEAIKEALENVDPDDRGRITSILDQVDDLREEANEKKSNSQTWEKLDAQDRERAQKASEQAGKDLEAAFKQVASKAPEAHRLLRTVDPTSEGGKEWNEPIERAIQEAPLLLRPDADPRLVLEAAILAKRYPDVEKLAITQQAKIKELESRVAEFESANPDFKGTEQPKVGPDKRTPGEKYTAKLQELSGKGEED